MPRLIELSTARLHLRAPRADDAPALATLNGDPEVMEHFPSVLTREESDRALGRLRDHFDAHGWGMWFLSPTASLAAELPAQWHHPRFLGICGLQHAPFAAPGQRLVEVGWRLAAPLWRRGLVTEAATAALDLAFRDLGLDEVVACTVPGNRRSRAVMERLGMRHDPDGDFEHPRVPEGHALRRHVLYRLPRHEHALRRGDT